jgi:hypothetical protein
MDQQIIRADRRLRVMTLAAAALVLVSGAVMLALLSAELRELRTSGSDAAGTAVPGDDAPPPAHAPAVHAADPLEMAIDRLERWTTVLGWIGGLGFVGAGAWLFALGWRINRAGQYPPPRMKVIRDTRVRTGPQARALANVLQLAAFVLIAAGVVGTWWLHQVAVRILQHAGR